MVSFSIVVIALISVMIEIPRLKRLKLKKELWVFSVFMMIVVSLCLAQANGVRLPSVLIGMEFVYKPLSDLIFKWLSY